MSNEMTEDERKKEVLYEFLESRASWTEMTTWKIFMENAKLSQAQQVKITSILEQKKHTPQAAAVWSASDFNKLFVNCSLTAQAWMTAAHLALSKATGQGESLTKTTPTPGLLGRVEAKSRICPLTS